MNKTRSFVGDKAHHSMTKANRDLAMAIWRFGAQNMSRDVVERLVHEDCLVKAGRADDPAFFDLKGTVTTRQALKELRKLRVW